ncbi:hypothetical protein LEMLEM_LOCUS1065, partial [Lemmus lemmus]
MSPKRRKCFEVHVGIFLMSPFGGNAHILNLFSKPALPFFLNSIT